VIARVIGVLLIALAATETGCAWGYVTFFEPELKGAREIGHRDPYMRPPPPAAVELAKGSLSIGCTNIRKFVFLPFPWLRRGFRPSELQIEVGFYGEPRTARIDLGTVSLSIAGETSWPSRVEYEGRRPAPQYVETVKLPTGGRVRLDAPTRLTLTFATDAGDADEFKMSLGAIDIDGTRILLPPFEFEREGDFVSYHSPEKKSAPGDAEPSDDL